MTDRRSLSPPPLFLGIEGGGTKTVAIVASPDGTRITRVEAGSANFRLLRDDELEARLREVHPHCPTPAAIGIGMAGVREEADRARLRKIAGLVWPEVPVFAGNDLETALAASTATPGRPAAARVVIISGTGSCVFGQSAAGKSIKVGGWGHYLGDRGSGYDIGLSAVKESILHFDRTGQWPPLGARLLRSMLFNEPNDFIAWAQKATKAEVAVLAVDVFEAAQAGDRLARNLLNRAATMLAEDAVTCARRLCGRPRPVVFVLAGSVLLKQPAFSQLVKRKILADWPSATVQAIVREGAWGGVALAQDLWNQAARTVEHKSEHPIRPDTAASTQARSPKVRTKPRSPRSPPAKTIQVEWASAETSPTEQRNPRSLRLDQLKIEDAIELMASEDRLIPDALLKEKPAIARAIRLIVAAFRTGGRLLYAGAGTSGRLGVLDASECPPTFRVPPEQVQGIMAGGHEALWRSVEGAEDDAQAGALAIAYRGVKATDVVVGIAASGRTPFVWGALGEARARGARTVLLCLNPHLSIPRALRPDVVVAPNVGPEILTGSTRLKAGTATKLVLNMFTTVAMVRTGKVVSNLMVDLNPSNVKLQDRAVRIVKELTGVEAPSARQHLEASGWVVKDALRRALQF